MSGSIVVVGDYHAPFHCRRSEEKALKFIQREKPSVVVQIGDLYDQYSHSKYARSHNVMTPLEEENKARNAALALWDEIARLVPKADLFQILGNHDDRMMKRIMSNAPEHEHHVKAALESLYSFPGVRTINDSSEELIVGDICFIHGHKKMGEHAPFNQMSTVHGHTHVGGVLFFANRHGPYWELDCGFLGDKKSKVFSYKAQKKLDQSTNGIGVIDEFGPRFVPFN